MTTTTATTGAEERAPAIEARQLSKNFGDDILAVDALNLTVPQGSTYRIVTRWHNHTTGLHHTFVSEPVPFDPAPYLTGRPVSVWLDPDKPKRYVMDINFLADAHARATG